MLVFLSYGDPHSNLSMQLRNRLKLTKEKLSTVSQGIRAIAQQDDPIDKVSAPLARLIIVRGADRTNGFNYLHPHSYWRGLSWQRTWCWTKLAPPSVRPYVALYDAHIFSVIANWFKWRISQHWSPQACC
jgi:hypothetical protein